MKPVDLNSNVYTDLNDICYQLGNVVRNNIDYVTENRKIKADF